MVFVGRVGHFGGSVVSLRTLLSHLDPSVHRAYVGSAAGPVMATLVRERLVDETMTIRWRGPHAVMAAWKILFWAVARRRRLAAIHANGTADLLLAWPAALVTGRPLVVWVHDQAIKRWAIRLAPFIRQLGVRWAAVSDFNAQALVESGLARAEQVTIVPNPIGPSVIASPEPERIPHADVRIGYLGTDTERKGFPLLGPVAEQVARDGVRWLIFSNRHEDLPERVASSWQALDVLGPERVEVVGRIDDVRRAYAECDIVFVPSLQESFGRVVAEAMANGIPVVASDLPAIRTVLGTEAGVLFRPGDASAAAAALQSLVADEARRARMGAVGRVRATAFGPAMVARRFEELYGIGPDGEAG